MAGPDVAEELRNWFWFGELQLLPGSLDEILGKVIQALAQMHAGEPPQLKSNDDKLVWAWTLMTHEVDEAVPILTELMQVTLPLARRRGVALAGIARHPSVLASIWQGLDRPDLNEVVINLSACNYLVNHLSDGDKNRLVEKVGEVCQRGYKQRRKYPALFGGQHNRFFSAVTSLLRALWTNQSLAMFGSVVKDRDFRLGSFLGQGYIAPDDFSIEAIIGQIDYAHSFAAQDLWASPLKAQHWAALLLKHHPPDEDVPTMYAQAMQGRVTQQIFDEVVQILQAAPQPTAADTAQKLASAAARLKPHPN